MVNTLREYVSKKEKKDSDVLTSDRYSIFSEQFLEKPHRITDIQGGLTLTVSDPFGIHIVDDPDLDDR